VGDLIKERDASGVLRAIGITPGKRYRPDELVAIITQAKADKLRLQGYVLRMDAEGMVEIVHHSLTFDQPKRRWSKVRGPRGDKRGILKAKGFDGAKDPGGPPVQAGGIAPVKKRTAQQRIDSMMNRWIEDCKKNGTVPGINDPMMSMILGEAWMNGMRQITAEDVRRVVQYFLDDAEKKKAEANRKLIVTPPHGS
jgi:hypothetical protein